jgi:Ser/Thr protein kinase RdoA (MazF antagonist)
VNDEPEVLPGDVVICHNDVFPEYVVYRDGIAFALLGFDFAAPGRRVYDVACLAMRMSMGGQERIDRRRRWFAAHRSRSWTR